MTAYFRRMRPKETHCETCNASLSVRCERPPCEAHPRGVFVIGPCARCAKKKRAPPPPPLAKFRSSGMLSELHKRIREDLCLDALGFKPEQWVHGYRCDDLHVEKRIIVEVNGDYVHANPAKHKAKDWIVLEGSRYRAQEKWDYDAKRTETLRLIDYDVLIVWESDDLDVVREALWALLRGT